MSFLSKKPTVCTCHASRIFYCDSRPKFRERKIRGFDELLTFYALLTSLARCRYLLAGMGVYFMGRLNTHICQFPTTN